MGEGSLQTPTVTTSAAGGACLGEAHVITVSGAANGASRAELEHALETVYADGGRNVAVDVSALESVEGALDVLLLHLARFRARGGDVVVACGGEPSVETELRIERRIDDAVASLLGGLGETSAEPSRRAARPEAVSSVTPVSTDTGAPCVRASERASRRDDERRSANPSASERRGT
jgi:anti-anti-sigma regulatory factor